MEDPTDNPISNDKAQVGQGNYEVKPGDCMESIAASTGYLWQTLWNLPENADLKNNRQPNVLLPGDRVTIPSIESGEQTCPTDQVHRFQLATAPCRLQLRFVDETNQPRSGIPFVLTVDGETTNGTLDGSGGLDVPIRPNASQGTIILNTQPDPETYPLHLGFLDPDSSTTGIRARLNNLGFSCANDGGLDSDLQTALKRFQLVNNLQPTGQIDTQTRKLLIGRHKS